MLVHAQVCVKVSVAITDESSSGKKKDNFGGGYERDGENDGQGKPFVFKVSYGEVREDGHQYYSTQEFGQACLEHGQKMLLKVQNTQKLWLESGFRLSFDSGEYKKMSSYKDKVDFRDNSEICVLWGSWLPSREKSKAEIYFNVLTSASELQDRSMFRFAISVDRNFLSVDISIAWMASKANSKRTPLPNAFPIMIKSQGGLSTNQKLIKLWEKSFNFREEGKFSIIVLANEGEKEEVKKSAEAYSAQCQNSQSDCVKAPYDLKHPGLDLSKEGLFFKAPADQRPGVNGSPNREYI